MQSLLHRISSRSRARGTGLYYLRMLWWIDSEQNSRQGLAIDEQESGEVHVTNHERDVSKYWMKYYGFFDADTQAVSPVRICVEKAGLYRDRPKCPSWRMKFPVFEYTTK